jgi:hypothetical protein
MYKLDDAASISPVAPYLSHSLTHTHTLSLALLSTLSSTHARTHVRTHARVHFPGLSVPLYPGGKSSRGRHDIGDAMGYLDLFLYKGMRQRVIDGYPLAGVQHERALEQVLQLGDLASLLRG